MSKHPRPSKRIDAHYVTEAILAALSSRPGLDRPQRGSPQLSAYAAAVRNAIDTHFSANPMPATVPLARGLYWDENTGTVKHLTPPVISVLYTRVVAPFVQALRDNDISVGTHTAFNPVVEAAGDTSWQPKAFAEALK